MRAVKEESLSNPENNFFNVADQALSNPLLTAKLHFLFSVAKQLVPFFKYVSKRCSYGLFLGTDLFEILKEVF